MFLIYMSSLTAIMTACLLLGLYVYHEDKKSRSNKLFLVNSLTLFVVVLLTFLIQIMPDDRSGAITQGVYNIFLLFFLNGTLAFYIDFTKQKIPPVLTLFLILLFFVYSIIFLSRSTEFLQLEKFGFFLVYRLAHFPFWYFFYSPYLVLLGLLMIIFLEKHRRTSLSMRSSKQIKIMILATLSAYGGGFIFLMVFPTLGMHSIPLITPYFFVLYLLVICYAITRYKLLKSSLDSVAPLALTLIQDIVVLLEPDSTIICANKNLGVLFECPSDSLMGKEFNQYIKNADSFKHQLDKHISFSVPDFFCRLEFLVNEKERLTDACITGIYDEFQELTSILVTCRENKGLKHFQDTYSLTPREIQIFILATEGKSGRDISEDLNISERTVETHLNNIYNKTGSKNRIELLHTARDFHIYSR